MAWLKALGLLHALQALPALVVAVHVRHPGLRHRRRTQPEGAENLPQIPPLDQRSVFQGELTAAQYRALTSALNNVIDPAYDSIVTYTARSPEMIDSTTLGATLGGPGDIL